MAVLTLIITIEVSIVCTYVQVRGRTCLGEAGQWLALVAAHGRRSGGSGALLPSSPVACTPLCIAVRLRIDPSAALARPPPSSHAPRSHARSCAPRTTCGGWRSYYRGGSISIYVLIYSIGFLVNTLHK